MAIKISGTEVVSNTRQLKNIASIDAGTLSVLNTNVITVTVAGGKFVIDGTPQQTITLAASGVYKFDQSDSSNANHPLRISTTADGTHGGGSAITVDFVAVGTAGQAGAHVTYTIQQDGADTYYYYCANHSGMGGQIKKLKLAADSTRGTLTKSFTSGETASITLSAAVSPTPVVSATKEVPQSGISSKGAWDVASNGSNYDRLNSAYNTTLTPTAAYPVNLSTYSGNYADVYQESGPACVRFKPDGTKMYTLGYNYEYVCEYNLSTAWDVSTASISLTFYVGNKDDTPMSMAFNSDGSKLFVLGQETKKVWQWNLSTAYQVNTASIVGGSSTFSVSSQSSAPNGLTFSHDGRWMFVTCYNNGEVYRYYLSTLFDPSTAINPAVTNSAPFNLKLDLTEENQPRDTVFNADGTKLYFIGTSSDTVFRYSLTTAYDLSTASYDSVSFSVASQESQPNSIFFKPDGTKFYVVGTSSDDVFEYDVPVSNILTLGTGSFAAADVGKTIEGNGGVAVLTAADGSFITTTAFTDSSAIAAGSWSMHAVAINATNGLEMSNGITGAWDISTVGYVRTLSVSSQNTTPESVFFKPDGTKMYIIGSASSTDSVYEYNLSTAWNISTAVYSQAFSLASQGSIPRDVFFRADGLKMYVADDSGNEINEYYLSTAWDVSTASYVQNKTVGAQASNPFGVFFKPDGLKMFVIGYSNAFLYEYTLSTAWDLSTASYNSVRFDVSNQETSPTDIFFKPDGLKMYVLGMYGDDVNEYNLSTAWNITTASFSQNISVSSQETDPRGIFFHPDGIQMYVVGTSGVSVNEYNLGSVVSSTGYVPSITNSGGQIDSQFWTDINSMTTDEIAGAGAVHYAVSTDNHTTWSIIKNGSGVRPIVRNNSGTWQYNSAESLTFNLATASQDSKYSVNSEQANPKGFFLSVDGTKMYVTGDTSDEVNEYSLSTAFDITTSQFVYRLDIGGQTTNPQGIFFKPDGYRMYIIAADNPDYVWQYNLSTAWDISTATYTSGDRIATGSQEGDGQAVFFKPDGTKMYLVGKDYDSVFQYALSTAWQVNTASYENKSFSVFSPSNFGDSDPTGLFIRSDGLKFFITGWSTEKVHQFSMSTAWDISTASSDNVSTSTFSILDPSSQESSPNGVFFKPDMTKMYIIGQANDHVRQYSVGTLNFTTSTTWANSTTNSELYALQQALTDVSINRMDKTQLQAVTDANHYTLGSSLDLMISLYLASTSSSVPSSDGVSINYDAAIINQGAILGTDYNYDFPNSTTVRVTSSAAQNLKVRVV